MRVEKGGRPVVIGRNTILISIGCVLLAGAAVRVWSGSAPRSPVAEPAGIHRQAPPQQQATIREDEAGKTQLPLVLLGTFSASDPALSHAMLRNSESQRTLVVGVGDEIEARAIVVAIERERVVLREDGVLRELAVDLAARGDPEPARTAPGTEASPTETQSSPAELESSLAELEETILGTMVDEARVVPRVEDGRVVGLDVSAIETGSRLERMGVRDGDVIIQFNATSIDSSDGAVRAVRELLRAEVYHVVVRRTDGTVEHLKGRWDGANAGI